MSKKIYVAGQYFLNNDLNPDEVRKQVREIASAGYEAIYGHARHGLKTPYFSEEWWKIIKIIIDECRANGMKFAIWDEDYFPSAIAGDRIIWNHPELAAQNIEFTIVEVKATDAPIKLPLLNAALLKCFAFPKRKSGFGKPIDITKNCGTIRTQWADRIVSESAYSYTSKIGMPHWRTSMLPGSKTYALEWKPEISEDYLILAAQVVRPTMDRHNTDILNEKTIAESIRYTHQEYLDHFGSETIATDFHSVFMDEPAPGGVFPWTGKFAEEFTAEHAYDIIEKLPHLAVDIDETSPMIRHDYRMTQMRLQCTNYLQQVQNWCHKHNIQSAGHLSRTEFISFVLNLWPNELRCCKDLDIPCTDPLGAGIAWRDAAAYHFGLKVVSSAAHIFGKKQAGSDALAVMGNETSLRDLKFSLDYQMVLGINFFNLHGLSYSFDGPRKDEVPPSLFYQHSQWKYMPALIEHAKKTCAALSTGEHICGIAMLYPSSSFNCKFNAKQTWDASKLERKIHLLADDLLSHQKDFDLIDEITLAEHPDGKMPENWQVIILPFLKFICAETTGVLEKFRARGGRVIVLGEIPQLLGTKLEKPLTQWDAPAEIFNSELTPEILSSLPGPELNGGGKENIFILRRKAQDKIISFLFNRAEKDFTGTYNNQAVKISAKGSLLLNGESTPDSKCLSRSETLDLSSGWQVKFPNNHIPLAIWQARNDPNSPSFKAYNLLDRQKNPLDSGENKVSYQSRFLYCGKTDTLKVVFDRSAMKGNWKLLFNDVEIKEFKNERVYDCYNFSADLTKYIRTGSTPSENIITIRTEGPERGLFEIPHLYGNFSCQYRHAYRSLPFLQGGNKPLQLKSLLPWQELGYPAFSGSAQYSIDIDITTAGKYQIDFGCVEDIADVFVDKNHIELLPWKPYGCMLGFLKEGKHTLTVDITNGPGNHDRLAMLTAGLLGPVTLYKLL